MRRTVPEWPSTGAELRQDAGALGDVLGVVADPFQAVGDPHHRQNPAQVAGCRRAAGDQSWRPPSG